MVALLQQAVRFGHVSETSQIIICSFTASCTFRTRSELTAGSFTAHVGAVGFWFYRVWAEPNKHKKTAGSGSGDGWFLQKYILLLCLLTRKVSDTDKADSEKIKAAVTGDVELCKCFPVSGCGNNEAKLMTA